MYMSDRPQGDDWWLASDGKWYPPQSRSMAPPPPQEPAPVPAAPYGAPMPAQQYGQPVPPSGGRRFVSGGLTGTLFGFQLATGVLAVIAGTLYFATYGLWLDFREGGDTRLVDVVDLANVSDGAAGIALISGLVVFILLVIWLNHAYKAAAFRGAESQAWSSGWAVGGWFIPLANFVIPKLVINEVDRMSRPELVEPIGTTWRSQRRTTVSDLWWVFYIAGIIVSQVGTAIDDVEALWIEALGYMIIGTGFILGAVTIRTIGQRLRPPRPY